MSSTTFPTIESAAAAVEGDIAVIERALDHIKRTAADRSTRYANANQAGSDLAFVVARFLREPERVGTDALQGAYDTFMGRHAGNFCGL